MEPNNSLINEFMGKTILVRTHWGMGTKDISLTAGDYKGVLLAFDGNFIKLEYEIKSFVNGINVVTKDIILINLTCILTLGEYRPKPEKL
jgi:hypothetical protein